MEVLSLLPESKYRIGEETKVWCPKRSACSVKCINPSDTSMFCAICEHHILIELCGQAETAETNGELIMKEGVAWLRLTLCPATLPTWFDEPCS